MIAEQSKQNIKTAFHNALRATLIRDPIDHCDISTIEDEANPPSGAGKWLFLTLSSFTFRLLVIFCLSNDSATRKYYLREGSSQTLEEVFAEVANMCGGAFNRDLSRAFPHLAMSTPTFVSKQCVMHLRELKPHYLATFPITIDHDVRLNATLCLCCSAPMTVDGSVTKTEVEGDVGELELF